MRLSESTSRQTFPDRRAAQTVIMLLLGTLKGWSLQKLQERLSAYHDPQWRRLCGLPLSEVPPYSTLAYRSHNAKVKRWQERLYQRMLRVLLNCRNLGLLAIDMTDLPRDLKDKLANWGVCGKGSFYGYKVHLIVTRAGALGRGGDQGEQDGADGDRSAAPSVAAEADEGASGMTCLCRS